MIQAFYPLYKQNIARELENKKVLF